MLHGAIREVVNAAPSWFSNDWIRSGATSTSAQTVKEMIWVWVPHLRTSRDILIPFLSYSRNHIGLIKLCLPYLNNNATHLWLTCDWQRASNARLQYETILYETSIAQLLLRMSRSYGVVWNSRTACWRWPSCVADQNSWLRSTKLFSRWSVSVEQSASGNQDDITDTQTVLWPAENWSVSS